MFEQNWKNGPKLMTPITMENVNPIPYTDGNEEFSLNITPAEIEAMKDASGDIRFCKLMEHLLPRFDSMVVG